MIIISIVLRIRLIISMCRLVFLFCSFGSPYVSLSSGSSYFCYYYDFSVCYSSYCYVGSSSYYLSYLCVFCCCGFMCLIVLISFRIMSRHIVIVMFIIIVLWLFFLCVVLLVLVVCLLLFGCSFLFVFVVLLLLFVVGLSYYS